MDKDIIMTDADAAAAAAAAADEALRSEIRSEILSTRPPFIPKYKYRFRLRRIAPYKPITPEQDKILSRGEMQRYMRHFNHKVEQLVDQEIRRRKREIEEQMLRHVKSRAEKRRATEDDWPEATKRPRTTDDLKDENAAAQPLLDAVIAPNDNILRGEPDAYLPQATMLLKAAQVVIQQCVRSGVQMAATLRRRLEEFRETRGDGNQGGNEDEDQDGNAQLQAELTEHITHLASLTTIVPAVDDPSAAQLQAELAMHASSSEIVQPHMPSTNAANLGLQDTPMVNPDTMAPEHALPPAENILQEEPVVANQEAEAPADAHEEPVVQAAIPNPGGRPNINVAPSTGEISYERPPPTTTDIPTPPQRPCVRVVHGRTRSYYVGPEADVDFDELARQLEAEENGQPWPPVEPEEPAPDQAEDAQNAVPPAADVDQQGVADPDVEAVAEPVIEPVAEPVHEPVPEPVAEPVVEPAAEQVAPQPPAEVVPWLEDGENPEEGDDWVYRPGVPPIAPWLGIRLMHHDLPAAPAAPVAPVAAEVPAAADVPAVPVIPAPVVFAPPATPAPAQPQREIETEVEETTDQLAVTTVVDEVQLARDRDRDPTGRSVGWFQADTPMGRPVSAVQLFNVTSPPVNAGNRTAPLAQAEWQRIEAENRRREEEERQEERKRLVQEKSDSLGRVCVPAGEDAVKPLSDAWERHLERLMSSSSNRILVTTLEGAELGKQKLDTCYQVEAWLNDEVVNGHLALTIEYLRRVTNNQGRNVPPKYYAFNSFFYKRLREAGHTAVERWTRRARISGRALLDVETLFVPVHEGAHWTLLVLSPKNRTIEYFDSLWGRTHPFISNIKKWLKGELGDYYHEDEWCVLNSLSPKQDNYSDCGVFLLTTAKAIALGLEPTIYGPEDIPLIRRKIVAELLNGGLQGDFEPAKEASEKRL